MFDDPGCEWCRRWDREIGVAYPDTEIGGRVPLRRVSISDPRPAELQAIGPIRFTPTFVLLHKGRELGRIIGYSGEEFFWGYLEEMAERIPRPKKNAGIGSAETRK